jgi:acyl-CoA synthetase (AMP-forming)/AMP-acid ligase II
MLLTSPRNSLEGQLDLLNKTDCKVILSARGYNIQPELLSQSGASLLHVQELEELLATGEINKYNFSKSFEAAVKDPFVVLHTSGSTGLLKPVILTHGWPTAFDSHSRLPELNGYSALFPELGNKRTFSSLPPFHVSSIFVSSQYVLADSGIAGSRHNHWAIQSLIQQHHSCMATVESTSECSAR